MAKVVGIDNFARETVSDVIVGENLTDEEAGTLVDRLNANSHATTPTWYVVKSDDYVLYVSPEP